MDGSRLRREVMAPARLTGWRAAWLRGIADCEVADRGQSLRPHASGCASLARPTAGDLVYGERRFAVHEPIRVREAVHKLSEPNYGAARAGADGTGA